MGSILAVLERLLERQTHRKLIPEPATIPPYPDASKAVEDFRAADVLLYSLTDFPTLIEVAANEGHIKRDQAAKAIQWNQDPSGWGKKMGYE